MEVDYNSESATMQIYKNDYFGEMENYYLNLEQRLIRSKIKCSEFKEKSLMM